MTKLAIANTYNQPIAQVHWLDRDLLDPNNYNPNTVFAPELELLKTSILEDGWTQPIVTLPEQNGRYQIVDGFHRWKVSADDEVYRLTNGFVPTVQVKLDPVHQQMSTIRHNRARGTHGVLKMASIVREILAAGVSEKELIQRLGMEREEVVRLNNRAGMPEQAGKQEFGKAWIPKSNR
ncbi:ParB N-terminal domain-containing protein [Chroococcidiopsis sp.]|uniref:ParB N-terminal domain-containing protein n=1 Tax=Chroococcidiopsis sp. TaxID=3088168 RepID=UPI003F2FA3EB